MRFFLSRVASWAFLCVGVGLLWGCASTAPVLSDREYFHQGMNALSEDSNTEALRAFENLTRYYPQSNYARQGYLELMWLLYRARNFNELELTSDRFAWLFFSDPRMDYARYMKAVALFEGGFNVLDPYIYTDLDLRDFKAFEAAYRALSDFVRDYPDSLYVPEAKQRLRYLRNRIANRELKTARYYFDQGNLIAALSRAKFVHEQFPASLASQRAKTLMLQVWTKEGDGKMAEEYLGPQGGNALCGGASEGPSGAQVKCQ